MEGSITWNEGKGRDGNGNQQHSHQRVVTLGVGILLTFALVFAVVQGFKFPSGVSISLSLFFIMADVSDTNINEGASLNP
jgi:hypothetical protein